MKKDDIKSSADLFFYKASVDFNAAKLLLSSFANGVEEYDLEIVMFHLQQSVEKLLKAILSYYRKETPRTHDLEKLVSTLLEHGIEIPNTDMLLPLTQFVVEGRYAVLLDDIHEAEIYLSATAQLIEYSAGILQNK